MNAHLEKDLASLGELLETAQKQALNYLNNITDRPTSARQSIGKPEGIPGAGLGAETALQHFNKRIEPIIVSSSGPRYWGYVVGGSTPASIVGDWLTTVYDQCTFATKGQGDTSAQIELETIQMLLELFELPGDFTGGFVSGATMSNFTCLAVARQWIGKQKGKDFAKEGVSERFNILSAMPHSSVIKSLSMLGVGSNSFVQLNVLQGNREAMDVADLEAKIAAHNGEPFILVSSGGTVNTGDFDDFKAIAKLKEKHSFWWHIDAAFGALAACTDTHKHLITGWETADSITVDCHKWLNIPYENAVVFIKDKHLHLQVETFQNSNAPYLGNPRENFNYINLLPENSRRLKALPVWFSLMAYGKQGYKEIVENDICLAKSLGAFIESSDLFELLAPVRLNIVCFSLKGKENQDMVHPFLTRLNETGRVFMTPAMYNGRIAIRAAFANWRTTTADVDIVIDLMIKTGNGLLAL